MLSQCYLTYWLGPVNRFAVLIWCVQWNVAVWIWCVWWSVCGFDGCGGAWLCGFDVSGGVCVDLMGAVEHDCVDLMCLVECVWIWWVRWSMTVWIWCVQCMAVCLMCAAGHDWVDLMCAVECDCVHLMCAVCGGVWLCIWYVQCGVTDNLVCAVAHDHVHLMCGGVCLHWFMFAVECDFEVDFCGYTQNTNDQFDWQRHANSTSSVGTGPSHDHTTNNGYGEDSCHDLHVQQHWTCREGIFPSVFSCYIFCYVKATESLQALEQINSVVFCLLEWL